MMLLFSIFALCWASLFPAVAAAAVGDVALHTRDGDADTVDAVAKALRAARDSTYSMNQTSLAKSWANATLFSAGISGSRSAGQNGTLTADASIELICTACYINGSVKGSLTISDDFNLTQAIHNVEGEVENATISAVDTLGSYVETVLEDIATLDLAKIPAWPTLDIDFNLANLSSLPSVNGRFEFDALELYLDLELKMNAGATYTLNLFTSETEAGFSIPNLEAGAIFSVTLILISKAEVDISGGIHLKLDDGLALDLELFNQNTSGITLPGAQFEFLPITIEGQGSIQALLQLETRLGFRVSSPELASLFSASTGVEANLFAYVADFLVEVDGSSTDDCEIAAVAEYTLAVGGAAGATVAIDTYQWGPSPNTTTPIWYTTLASICANSKTASTTSTSATAVDVTARAALQPRDTPVTTTVSTTESYTIVNCLSTGLINCPINLQSTTTVKQTLTSVLTVPSGSSATYPASTHASVTSAIAFGSNVFSIAPTSGTPTSYTPPKPTSSSSGGTGGGSGSSDGGSGGGGGLSHRDKLIIGLTVGLGVPFLAIVIAGLWLIFKRKNSSPVPQPETSVSNTSFPSSDIGNNKTPPLNTYPAT
ncbi:uncharacterized protein TRUGW13939_05189 [Talaromyces rugulosus]|uniref:Mid2 domain-containing protein n=1 Tax=Talaromyces rugulosus TaxID=121627 RepID=A0A7H8QWS0_TALRU|nr:uncharacterized protein TRUGW13939_05189 [Talaromyces rugulosus]QKX58068.1 hypothetical protein TRUGW13939_05189 [Talaromyces rugulosus]